VSALKLEDVVASVQAQLLSGNLEMSVVGDFDPEELDKYILQYLGTVNTKAPCIWTALFNRH
jgi:predicted Zn-dependent peptidase